MEAIVAKKSGRKTKKIPEYLIYEMDEGKPIYYRGYREYLQGKRQLEEITSSYYLQSFIVSELFILLIKNLSNDYRIYTNEAGLQLKKKSCGQPILPFIKKLI